MHLMNFNLTKYIYILLSSTSPPQQKKSKIHYFLFQPRNLIVGFLILHHQCGTEPLHISPRPYYSTLTVWRRLVTIFSFTEHSSLLSVQTNAVTVFYLPLSN